MGLRYRKNMRLLPGIRLHIDTKGLTSLIIRLKCLQFRINKRGIQGRLHFPKLGLSYRFGSGRKRRRRRS